MKKDEFDVSLYSLVIYQNDAFVDGLYQSIYGGKINTSTFERGESNKRSGDVKLDGKAKLGVFGKGVEAGATGTGKLEKGGNNKTTQSMSYTQSYYLHKVREVFYASNGIKILNQDSDFGDIMSTDFIEFRATFEKNDLVNVLDMVTPQLGGVIGHVIYTNGKAENQIIQSQADGQFQLGKSIVEALHKEFRNETSSEFYGRVIDKSSKSVNATAVLICDKDFFANEDEDRILDGEFTVFGKVVAKSTDGLSKFERNKILKRIKSNGKDWLVKKISELKNIDDYIDTSIDFDIEGNVIKVIPIAIYT